MDYYTYGILAIFVIWYCIFFYYGGCSFARLYYLIVELFTVNMKTNTPLPPQTGTQWNIRSMSVLPSQINGGFAQNSNARRMIREDE